MLPSKTNATCLCIKREPFLLQSVIANAHLGNCSEEFTEAQAVLRRIQTTSSPEPEAKANLARIAEVRPVDVAAQAELIGRS